MSFDITFDGSLVDKRDLPEITTSSSLTKQSSTSGIVSPSAWEFEGTGPVSFGSGIFPPDPGSSIVPFFQESINSNNQSGGNWNISLTSGGVFGVSLFFIIEVPLGSSGGIISWATSFAQNVQGYFITYQDGNGSQTGAESIVNGFPNSATLNRSWPTNTRQVLIEIFTQQTNTTMAFDWLYFRVSSTITTTVPVNITPSTLVNGANKTGGTLITPTVQTLQDGSPAISGPANRFGLNVRDNGTTKLAPQFFPSALDSEESSATITEEKTITAESTDLSVEGTGLGGTEKLERGSSVIVEDVTSYEDNV